MPEPFVPPFRALRTSPPTIVWGMGTVWSRQGEGRRRPPGPAPILGLSDRSTYARPCLTGDVAEWLKAAVC